jgi:methyltransferase (TIGR00027 family)
VSLDRISQAAHWVAYLRAIESERVDALFRDPYARDLAGPSGEATANAVGSVDLIANAIAIRTVMLDRLLTDMVARHEVDLVLNIGCGLDTRPWRLKLPATLQWLDLDIPALVSHKARVLLKHPPGCNYEAIGVDVLDSGERTAAVTSYPDATRILVVTEGLLVYLHPAQVEALAKDLHRLRACRWWLTDLVGPAALRAVRDVWEHNVAALDFQFAPASSGSFFAPLGWRELSFHSAGDEARRLNRSTRTPVLARLGTILASPGFSQEFRRLAGVVSLARHELKLTR